MYGWMDAWVDGAASVRACAFVAMQHGQTRRGSTRIIDFCVVVKEHESLICVVAEEHDSLIFVVEEHDSLIFVW